MEDLIIIGGGPAALTAAIYATRYKLKTLVLGDLFGGAMGKTLDIENYPGIDKISGMELAMNMKNHAEKLGAVLTQKKVTAIEQRENIFTVTAEGETFQAKSIILATGSNHRHLDVPGEKEFAGKGVSYCATCDAPFFTGKTVAVIGGNDSAVKAALILAEHAEKVLIIYRKETIRAEPALIDKVISNKKIEIINNTNITEIVGSGMVTGVKLDSGKDLELQGVFVEIGSIPDNALAQSINAPLDNDGFLIVNEAMATTIPGVFGAGDNTTGSGKFWQIATAVSEGARAAHSAFEYLKSNFS